MHGLNILKALLSSFLAIGSVTANVSYVEKAEITVDTDEEEPEPVDEGNIEVSIEEQPAEGNENIVVAVNAQEFAGAVAVMPDDSENRLMVASSDDLSEVLTDVNYTAVEYEGIYVVDFATEQDLSDGVTALTETVGDQNISKDVTFTLDENEDTNEPVKETEILEEQNSEENQEETEQEEPLPNENEEPAVISNNGIEPLPQSQLSEISQEEDKIVVALIDSGVEKGLADEYVNLTDSETVYDENGHGTRMAEAIKEASEGKALILSIKAFDAEGHSSSSTMYAAVKYAMEAGADIINISASANDSQDAVAFKSVILQAQSIGIGVIASVGNQNIDAASRIPANIDGVIGVTNIMDDGKTIIGGYGRYADLGVVTGSTSVATAIVSGLVAAGTLEEHYGIDVFELDEDGEEAIDPIDDHSDWKTDCASVLFIRAAIQQLDGTYIAGAYTTTNGKSDGTRIATYRVYGGTPTWWEDGNTSKAQGGINSGGRTWFYMDNEGSGAYDTNSPEYNHIASSRPYYGNSQYAIYHGWAAGKILGNFQVDQISVTNSNYKYAGYHMEYYENDSQLGGASNSNTEAQARELANQQNAFFYENAYNVGSPSRSVGSPTSLNTGTTIYSSFSKSAAAGGHASYNSSNFGFNNSWRRIHITLAFDLNLPKHDVYVTYKDEDTGNILTPEFKAVEGVFEGGSYSYNTAERVTVNGITYARYAREDGGDPATISGTMGTEDAHYVVTYKRMYNLTINYYEANTENKVHVSHGPEAKFAEDTYSIDSPNVAGYRLVDSDQSVISGTMPAEDVTVNVYYRKTLLSLEKVWNGDVEHDSVQMVILKPDGTTYQTVTLTAAENWKKTINVDYGSTYSIYETGVNAANYTSSCTQNSPCRISTDETVETASITRNASVTNRRINEVTVTKQWTEEDGYLEDRPTEVMAYLVDMDTQEVVLSHVLNNANGWSWTWKDTVIDLQNKQYGVYEDVPDMYDCANYDAASAKPVDIIAGKKSLGTVTLVNEYTPTFPVEKKVFNVQGNDIHEKIVYNGTTLYYTVYVTNPTRRARKFDVEDVIPDNSMYIANTADNGGVYDTSTNKITWTGVEIAGNSTKEFHFNVRAIGQLSAWSEIRNVANAWMQKSSGARNDKTKQTTNEVVNYVPPQRLPTEDYKQVTDSAGTDIDTLYVEKDRNLYYHIPVTNGSPLAKTFTITDEVPANTEFVSVGQSGVNNNGVVTWVADLAAGETKTFEFVVRVTNDNCDIENTAHIAVDEAKWDTNTVYNHTAKIVIDKALSNYYESFGATSFLFKITGTDGSVGYRMIEITNQTDGTTEYTVPMYTEEDTQFTVNELRNARYEYENLDIVSGAAAKVDETAVTSFSDEHRIAEVRYTDSIRKFNKASHADSVTNRVD